MQRLKGETDEQWMQRIGHVGSVFGTGKNQTAVPNAGKILYGAFKDSWKTSHDQFTKLAFERGYMNQAVAELERQFSAIKPPGAMRSFVFGDTKANQMGRASCGERVGQFVLFWVFDVSVKKKRTASKENE